MFLMELEFYKHLVNSIKGSSALQSHVLAVDVNARVLKDKGGTAILSVKYHARSLPDPRHTRQPVCARPIPVSNLQHLTHEWPANP